MSSSPHSSRTGASGRFSTEDARDATRVDPDSGRGRSAANAQAHEDIRRMQTASRQIKGAADQKASFVRPVVDCVADSVTYNATALGFGEALKRTQMAMKRQVMSDRPLLWSNPEALRERAATSGGGSAASPSADDQPTIVGMVSTSEDSAPAKNDDTAGDAPSGDPDAPPRLLSFRTYDWNSPNAMTPSTHRLALQWVLLAAAAAGVLFQLATAAIRSGFVRLGLAPAADASLLVRLAHPGAWVVGLLSLAAWPITTASSVLDGALRDASSRPREAVAGLFIGLAVGVVLAIFKYRSIREGRIFARALRLQPGTHYIRALVKRWPQWIELGRSEPAEFFNRLLDGAWPYLSKALGDKITDSLGPVLEANRPGFIKSLEIKRFNFGVHPIKVGAVSSQLWSDREIALEMDVSWVSDADIQVGVVAVTSRTSAAAAELAAMSGSQIADGQGLLIKVQDITVKGTMRIIFTPLIPTMPMFGGMIISFLEEPVIRFRPIIAGGAAGALATPVLGWVSTTLTRTLAKAFVWPERIAIDMSKGVPKDLLPIGWNPSMLEPHISGCLEVRVLSTEGIRAAHGKAKRLQRAAEKQARKSARESMIQQSASFRAMAAEVDLDDDSGLDGIDDLDDDGVSVGGETTVAEIDDDDGNGKKEKKQKDKKEKGVKTHIEMFIRPRETQNTSPRRAAGSTVIDERLRFLVKEVDHEVLQLAVRTGAVGREDGKGVLSRGTVKIGDIVTMIKAQQKAENAPPRSVVLGVPVGSLAFREGGGSGLGTVHVECLYTPSVESRDLARGVVSVKVVSASKLPKMDVVGWCDAYVVVTVRDDAKPAVAIENEVNKRKLIKTEKFTPRRTPVKTIKDGDTPATFGSGEPFEWFGVSRNGYLTLSVLDQDPFSADDPIGSVQMPITDICNAPGGRCEIEAEFPVTTPGPGKTAGTTIKARVAWVGMSES